MRMQDKKLERKYQMKELLKAIKLLLRGRLYLLPIDSKEETGLRLNSDKTVTLMFPDQKYLDKAKEHTMTAVILSFYIIDCIQGLDGKHFSKWFKKTIKTKKGNNK